MWTRLNSITFVCGFRIPGNNPKQHIIRSTHIVWIWIENHNVRPFQISTPTPGKRLRFPRRKMRSVMGQTSINNVVTWPLDVLLVFNDFKFVMVAFQECRLVMYVNVERPKLGAKWFFARKSRVYSEKELIRKFWNVEILVKCDQNIKMYLHIHYLRSSR